MFLIKKCLTDDKTNTRKARLAHGVTVAESKTGGIIYAVGGSAEVGIIIRTRCEERTRIVKYYLC